MKLDRYFIRLALITRAAPTMRMRNAAAVRTRAPVRSDDECEMLSDVKILTNDSTKNAQDEMQMKATEMEAFGF